MHLTQYTNNIVIYKSLVKGYKKFTLTGPAYLWGLSHRTHRVYSTVVAVEPTVGWVTWAHSNRVCATCDTCVASLVYVFAHSFHLNIPIGG